MIHSLQNTVRPGIGHWSQVFRVSGRQWRNPKKVLRRHKNGRTLCCLNHFLGCLCPITACEPQPFSSWSSSLLMQMGRHKHWSKCLSSGHPHGRHEWSPCLLHSALPNPHNFGLLRSEPADETCLSRPHSWSSATAKAFLVCSDKSQVYNTNLPIYDPLHAWSEFNLSVFLLVHMTSISQAKSMYGLHSAAYSVLH